MNKSATSGFKTAMFTVSDGLPTITIPFCRYIIVSSKHVFATGPNGTTRYKLRKMLSFERNL
jgi:hypothetical protein